jgi:hypothetical protein
MMNPYMNPYRSKIPQASKLASALSPSNDGATTGAATTSHDDKEIVHVLQQLTLAWDDALVQKLRNDLFEARNPSLWSWSTWTLFLEFVFSSRHCERQRSHAAVLLAKVLDEGTEEQAYAAALFHPDSTLKHRDHDPHKCTALDILSRSLNESMGTSRLQQSSTSTEDAPKRYSLTAVSSLVALTAFWRALDRLQSLLSFALPFSGATNGIHAESAWYMTMAEHKQQSSCATDPIPEATLVQLFRSVEALEDGDSSSTSPSASSCNHATRLPSAAEMRGIGLRPEEIQTAVLAYLHQVQKYRSASSAIPVVPTGDAAEWTQRLFVLASRLCDRDMPRTSYTHLSLSALRLLIGQSSSSTSSAAAQPHASLQPMVSVVIRSFLDGSGGGGGDHRLPRWTNRLHLHSHQHHPQHHPTPWCRDELYKWTLGIVLDWTRTQHHALTEATPVMAQSLWKLMLQVPPTAPIPTDLCSGLLVLVTQSRSVAREGLELAMQEQQHGSSNRSTANDVMVHAATALVERLVADQSFGSLLLMSVLMKDGQSLLTHDAWSKGLWRYLAGKDATARSPASSDGRTSRNALEEYARMALQTASAASAAQDKGADRHIQYTTMHPKLQCLMDLLNSILTHVEAKAATCIVPILYTAQSVETLVQIASPKRAKVDYNRDQGDEDAGSFVLDLDESMTPTANNLSRIDTSVQICLQEYERSPVGIEPSIRLACANVLAVMSNSCLHSDRDDLLACSRRPLLQARMLEVANSFVEDLQLSFVMPCLVSTETERGEVSRSPFRGSYELTQRRLRLVTTLALLTDNQEYLACTLHRTEATQLREAQKRQQATMKMLQRIQELVERQNQLETEKVAWETQLVAQQAALQEQMARFQRNCSQNAKQLVHVHQVESSRAERRAEDVVIRMKDMQDRLALSERQLEASRKLEAETQSALERAHKSVEELHHNHQSLLQESETRARELDHATEELQRTKPKLERLIRNETKMLAHIQLQDESLQELSESHAALKESLETLFADMVSLAQLYESKEKEEYQSREQEESTIEDLTRKLRAERARYAQLEETYKQTEVNNNMLSSKYEKVRKLLEQEREERNSESARFAAEQRKRYGPASYMSHLHTASGNSSITSDKSRRDRMRLVLSSDGKENDQSTTSASRASHTKSAASSSRHYR